MIVKSGCAIAQETPGEWQKVLADVAGLLREGEEVRLEHMKPSGWVDLAAMQSQFNHEGRRVTSSALSYDPKTATFDVLLTGEWAGGTAAQPAGRRQCIA